MIFLPHKSFQWTRSVQVSNECCFGRMIGLTKLQYILPTHIMQFCDFFPPISVISECYAATECSAECDCSTNMEFFDDNQLRFPEAVLLFCHSGVGLLIWMNCRITFVFWLTTKDLITYITRSAVRVIKRSLRSNPIQARCELNLLLSALSVALFLAAAFCPQWSTFSLSLAEGRLMG